MSTLRPASPFERTTSDDDTDTDRKREVDLVDVFTWVGRNQTVCQHYRRLHRSRLDQLHSTLAVEFPHDR